jgi:hypothetical protein
MELGPEREDNFSSRFCEIRAALTRVGYAGSWS